jgi:hypothetical protein
VDFVHVTGGSSSVRLLAGSIDDHASQHESFLCGKLSPEATEKPNEMTALVRMIGRTALLPYLDRAGEEHHPASGAVGILSIQLVKHICDDRKWKRGRVFVVKQEVESSFNVTVREHHCDNVDGRKSPPAMMGDWDVSQQVRRYRRRDVARFFKEVFAYWARKVPYSVQAFKQRPPRLRNVPG